MVLSIIQGMNSLKSKNVKKIPSWRHRVAGLSSHEPGGARLRRALIFCALEIRARRSLAPPFMVPMRDAGIVEALHEPESGLPAIQRLTQTRFMAPTHVQILDVLALHEPPPHPIPPIPLPPRRGRVPGGRVRGWFMVPMHAKNERRLSMNRPSPGLRPPSPRLAGRGQGEGCQSGSWSQCMRKSE